MTGLIIGRHGERRQGPMHDHAGRGGRHRAPVRVLVRRSARRGLGGLEVIGRALCRLLGHDWEPHPDFAALNRRRTTVRRCERCPRVETLRFGPVDCRHWERSERLELRG